MKAAVAGLMGLVLAAAPALQAQEAPAERPLRFTADFSYVDTGGNTDLVTVSVGEKIEYDPSARVGLRQNLSWVFGRSEGEQSANQLQAGVRGSYGFSDRLSIYTGVNYEYNLFAGVKRRFEELAGLGVEAVATERHRLVVEVGLSFFQETATDGLTQNFVAGRGALEYRFQFGEKAHSQQTLEYLTNFDDGGDYRVNSETALVAPLNSVLALKASYIIRHRGRPPEGFENRDTVFRTGIQVTL